MNYDESLEQERELYEGRQSDNETQWVYMVVVNGENEWSGKDEQEVSDMYDYCLQHPDHDGHKMELCKVDSEYFYATEWKETYSNSISICKNF